MLQRVAPMLDLQNLINRRLDLKSLQLHKTHCLQMIMFLKVTMPMRKVTPFMYGICLQMQLLHNLRRFLRNLDSLNAMVFKSEVTSRGFALDLWNLSQVVLCKMQ
nr:hypothetical protein Iba_chr03cCG7660 [Ipomoea batatas]